MKTIALRGSWTSETAAKQTNKKFIIAALVLCLTIAFIRCGLLLQRIDFTAAVLDIGILSVLLFGILALVLAIFCSLWLQEFLWQPFKDFRKNVMNTFKQCTSWQQCILYFSVFFLLLFASLWALAIVI
ncbi:hypothetical protein [Sphingobacterium bambusae]|uniref:DUF3899 domain-containing protein n=1 Tax=Sphingobacterium bambusae TaxID=662858 RepID=A0ABW6BEY7_9SPHI|nr:hypothetical protein [Sphingobacterium bambusae]WPL48805.1 hypothetical protein SCB77_22905 [Sphingobacterium bambusae]